LSKFIIITIKPDGQATVETQGFTGDSCQLASKLIEEALGNRMSEQLTAEFHQSSQAQQSSHQHA